MATLDIRDTASGMTTEIKFSNKLFLRTSNPLTIEIVQDLRDSGQNKLRILKSDIPNLIAALNKAKELGWY